VTGPTVFIVDDDDAARGSMAFLLETCGYEVRAFADGPTFLAAVEEALPDCVLLDLAMPGMDGIEVLRVLRSRGARTPVVLVTGHGQDEPSEPLSALGVTAVLPKPCTDEQLTAAIEAAV
jgi:two-component system, LuxR family, response regulator FixJ